MNVEPAQRAGFRAVNDMNANPAPGACANYGVASRHSTTRACAINASAGGCN